MVLSRIQQRFVDDQVGAALTRARLPYDSPIRQKLNADAEIIGPPGKGYVQMRDERGELVPVDDRIKELRADPDFRECFPDPPKVSRGNGDDVRENFDRIVRDEVEVVK